MSPQRNVLVTGAGTPLGERTVRTLLEDSRVGHVMAVMGEDPATYAVEGGDRLSCIQVDLGRARRVRNLLFGPVRERQIDVIAFVSMHRSAYAEGSRVHAFNVDCLRNVIGLSRRHPTIKRLVIRSAAEVYARGAAMPVLIEEDNPLNMRGNAPQWVADRVEADITACTAMGMSPFKIAVLRMAEILAPGTGSQLYDYLGSPVCLRPAGFDPMVNFLTLDDAVTSIQKAIHADAEGVFNVPGADTLPLSACIRKWGRLGLPVPGPWLTPLYRWRRAVTGHDFRYGMNRRRFHYSGVLDGTRARDVLRWVPCHPVSWPTD